MFCSVCEIWVEIPEGNHVLQVDQGSFQTWKGTENLCDHEKYLIIKLTSYTASIIYANEVPH